ncbi:MAG: Excinuclease ABC C subunit domain protein [Candidatus Roizmanbacteria bacterium GW2011_GWA2_35_19]|uniref:Excinuclease ABC C subunit domain protein n=2 Tax=Candidatus Roizmaniibacteriota TaxID=1752723 RepID=A0A0G0C9M3_9BACT|nr:MAG: Excinuclease ABC C subunit domain protein [Candidatus Roizmanbacteria bacterium GW2011_GWA2_35_19]
MNKSWYVYIITNYKNTVFYTGITNDLQRRLYEHKTGVTNNSFSKKYHLYKLIWFDEFNSPEDAIVIEKKVKDMRREKKLIFIKDKNPLLVDLSTLR